MVDYLQGTGVSGTMMIRDTGINVEFWINSGQSSTWWGSVNWAWESPNGQGNGFFGYNPGEGWKHVGTIAVTASGNVTWTIGDTGTQGVGGPTTQTVWLNRTPPPPPTKRPSPPGAPTFSEITPTSVKVTWGASTDNGGSPIDSYLLRYWPNAAGTGPYVDHSSRNDRSRVVTGLTPGNEYRFVVFAHNGSPDNSGFSNPSAAKVVRMAGIVWVRVSGTWRRALPYVRVNGVWKAALPYTRQNGTWKQGV